MASGEGVAGLLLGQAAVLVRPSDPFTFASGIRSPIYCDNRILLSDPSARRKIVAGFLEILSGLRFDVVGGVATAGIPWAAWLAEALSKPLVYVRGSAKEHGRKNRIEGKLPEGASVVLVEDLISTGGSVLGAVRAVREVGGRVTDAVSIFSYGFTEARENFEREKCEMRPLTTLDVLLAVAVRIKKISEAEADQVRTWRADPRSF